MKRNFTYLLILLCCVSFSPFTFGQETSSPPVIRVGHVGHDHQIALGMAATRGEKYKDTLGIWLQEQKAREVYLLHQGENILAQLQVYKVQGGSAMPAAMERGEIDIGLGGVAAVAFFIDRGNDFKIIAPLNNDGDMLVMKRDFGADSWASFVEKVKASPRPLLIGYKAPVAVAKLIFERGLAAEGIPFGVDSQSSESETAVQVRLVNLHGEKNMIPTLAAGAVDGFVTNEPSASLAEVQGHGKVVCDLSDLPPEGKWKHHPCCCVAARQEVLDTNEKAVTAFLALLLHATLEINADKDRAAEIAAEWTRTPLEVEQKSLQNIEYLAVADTRWEEGLKTWILMMQENKHFRERFATASPEDVRDHLCDFRFIQMASTLLER
jgi:NitT/TauT family transport system substrate-binding protein